MVNEKNGWLRFFATVALSVTCLSGCNTFGVKCTLTRKQIPVVEGPDGRIIYDEAWVLDCTGAPSGPPPIPAPLPPEARSTLYNPASMAAQYLLGPGETLSMDVTFLADWGYTVADAQALGIRVIYE